ADRLKMGHNSQRSVRAPARLTSSKYFWRNPLRHQIAIMVFKPELAVNGLRLRVASFDFQMQSADAVFGADSGQKPQRAFADPEPAILGAQINLIDERVASVELQAVAERQHGVSRDLIRQENQKHASQRIVANYSQQSAAGSRFIERRQPVVSVKVAHHHDQRLEVVGSGGV